MQRPVSHVSQHGLKFWRGWAKAQFHNLDVRFHCCEIRIVNLRQQEFLRNDPVDRERRSLTHFFREEMLQLSLACEILE